MGGVVEPTQHPAGLAAVESVLRPRAWRWHLLVTVLWAGVLVASTRVELGHTAFTVAVAVHVMGLVIGLGAVLLVDWYGLVWMAGLRTLSECLRLAQAAHPLIWFGLGLLLASGVGLAPDLGSTVAWIKQVLVLVLLNNGVALRAQSRRLRTVSTAEGLSGLPHGVKAQLVTAVAVSQSGLVGGGGVRLHHRRLPGGQLRSAMRIVCHGGAAKVRRGAADATRGPGPAGFARKGAVVLLPQAPTTRHHPDVAPGAGVGHARRRAGGCGVSAGHLTAPIGPLTGSAVPAGRCRAGSGPARAAGRLSPGPFRPATAWKEGPTRFPPPRPQWPELGPAGYGPHRRTRGRAPAPAHSRARTPARLYALGVPGDRAGRHPPAPSALRADQPGSADPSHNEGWHGSMGDWPDVRLGIR